eukprot:5240167-Amphidinium_carterae.1
MCQGVDLMMIFSMNLITLCCQAPEGKQTALRQKVGGMIESWWMDMLIIILTLLDVGCVAMESAVDLHLVRLSRIGKKQRDATATCGLIVPLNCHAALAYSMLIVKCDNFVNHLGSECHVELT